MSFEIDEKTQKQVREFRKSDRNIDYNHPNKWVRRVIVKNTVDEDILKDYALHDSFSKVRKEALRKIRDEKFLCQIVSGEKDNEVKRLALRKIKNLDILSHIAKRDENCNIRMLLINKVNDEKLFENRAFDDPCPKIRAHAAGKITNEEILKEIALGDDESDVRIKAITNLALNVENESTFRYLLDNDPDSGIKLLAMHELNAPCPLTQEDLFDEIVNGPQKIGLIAATKFYTSHILLDFWDKNPSYTTRKRVILRLVDDRLLSKIALREENTCLVIYAIAGIDDEGILRKTIYSSDNPRVKDALSYIKKYNGTYESPPHFVTDAMGIAREKYLQVTATKSFGYLDNLIHSAEGKIVLDADIALEDGEEDLYRNGINLNMYRFVIDGDEHSIDAKGMARIFNVTDHRIELRNVVLTNGYGEKGGAILNNGGISIRDSTLKNNHAKMGGAIFNRGKVHINGSDFQNNKSSLSGGAIENREAYKVRCYDSRFTDNSAESCGGAICNQGVLKIENCRLESNVAKRGGAIFTYPSKHKKIPNTRCVKTLCGFEEDECDFRDNEVDDTFEKPIF